MPFLESDRDRASLLILVLGICIALALLPFASGLLGGPVLFVVLVPLHRLLSRHVRPAFSALILVVLALAVLVVPTVWVTGLLVGQAQSLATGVIQGPILERLSKVTISGIPIGPRIVAAGEELVSRIASSVFGLLGTATRIGFNLTIAFFIAYYMLLQPASSWERIRDFIPFSPENADRLRDRFRDVTYSTVVGTGLVAVVQGGLVTLGFWLTGLGNAAFWGVVTAVLGILPVVGAGLVWGPAAITLALSDRWGAAIFLALLGVVVVGNVDIVIRPAVFRRFAQVPTLITLIGAIAGIGYFGLLGILIGPLALSYFFELMEMYRQEYLKD
jgi:predicted PurR-regulated permease PerM